MAGLIAALATVHIVLYYAGTDWQDWAFEAGAFSPQRYGAAALPSIPGAQVWSFLTYAFLHANWTHLLFNCLWLLVFGTVVARYLGPARFLLLAAISAIAGAAAMLGLHWGEPVVMIGASGAVSGMMAAAVPIMYGGRRFLAGGAIGDPRNAMPLSPGELLRSRGALIFLFILLAVTVLSGTSGVFENSFAASGNIAWEAHIGGFGGGLASFYLLVWRRMRR